jgi:hypothetical protein
MKKKSTKDSILGDSEDSFINNYDAEEYSKQTVPTAKVTLNVPA